MKSPMFSPTYDTETVRAMVAQATGAPTKEQDIWNLCRPGCALEPAVVRRGSFHVGKTKKVIIKLTQRRLLQTMGSKSLRLPGPEVETACPHCAGIAVLYNGVILCENEHWSNYS